MSAQLDYARKALYGALALAGVGALLGVMYFLRSDTSKGTWMRNTTLISLGGAAILYIVARAEASKGCALLGTNGCNSDPACGQFSGTCALKSTKNLLHSPYYETAAPRAFPASNTPAPSSMTAYQ